MIHNAGSCPADVYTARLERLIQQGRDIYPVDGNCGTAPTGESYVVIAGANEKTHGVQREGDVHGNWISVMAAYEAFKESWLHYASLCDSGKPELHHSRARLYWRRRVELTVESRPELGETWYRFTARCLLSYLPVTQSADVNAREIRDQLLSAYNVATRAGALDDARTLKRKMTDIDNVTYQSFMRVHYAPEAAEESNDPRTEAEGKYEYRSYPTSTMPGGDPPHVKDALGKSMETIKACSEAQLVIRQANKQFEIAWHKVNSFDDLCDLIKGFKLTFYGPSVDHFAPAQRFLVEKLPDPPKED